MGKRGLEKGAPDFDPGKLKGSLNTVGVLGVDPAISLRGGIEALIVLGAVLVALNEPSLKGVILTALMTYAVFKLAGWVLKKI